MTVIKMRTADQELICVQEPTVTSGDVGTVSVEYKLDTNWEDFTLCATFHTDRNPGNVFEQPLQNNACVVPWEVLQNDGILNIGLRGVDANGLIKTAAPCRYRIKKGSPSGTVTANEPSPDVYQQILASQDKLSKQVADLDVPKVTQEAGESESLVMSQKAVTDLVHDAMGENTEEYETVDSVEEMTDTSKMYILSSTNTLWAYGGVANEKEPPNKFVPGTVTLNQRLSSSSGSVSAGDSSVGSFITDYIAVSGLADAANYCTRLNWELIASVENKVVFFDSGKNRIGSTIFPTDESTYSVSNGETVLDLKNLYNNAAVSDWAAVAYVRLQLFVKETGTSITSSDVAALTITFDADRETVTEYQWYDTNLPPESASGGADYIGLLLKINQNKTDITEVSNRVTALETDSDAVTVPTFWQSAVDACIAKIKALQIGKNCVTFPFFSDNHQRNGYAGLLIAHVMRECGIPYAFFGGDSISSGYIADEAEMIAQDKAFDTAMSYIPNGRFCRAVGNHDGYWAVDASNKNYYTDAQNYDLFLREESTAQNKHFGGDGTYYYVDDAASKVRFVVLDTNDGTVEAEQIEWLQNTALSFDEVGWAAVMISHQPISNHYHALISNAADVISVVNASGVDIIGWFSGHIHRDRIYTGIAANTSDDTVGEPLGFTQVTITSDYTSIAYDDATKHTVGNDDQSHAIDFVTVNRDTRTVHITRLGIGNDRSYTYSAAENPYEPVWDYVLTEEDKQEIADMIETDFGGGGTAEPGKVGVTFIPSVSDDGVLSWTNDGGLSNPDPVKIKGSDGVGIASVKVTIDDNGDNVLNFTMTDETGTMFIIENGKNGAPGATFTPHVSADGILSWTNSGGHQNPAAVSIKGVPGDDYVLTDDDRAEIASAVIAALPVYNGEVSEV